jgi:hypothetical protein
MPRLDLDTAVQFVRELEVALAPNYHAALAGSTLHKGHSEKDVDVLIIPHSSDHNRYEEVHDLLVAFGMRRTFRCTVLHKRWAKKGSTDKKYVEVWDHGGLRVDVIQLSPPSPNPAYYRGPIECAETGDVVMDWGTGMPYTLRDDGSWSPGASVYYGSYEDYGNDD